MTVKKIKATVSILKGDNIHTLLVRDGELGEVGRTLFQHFHTPEAVNKLEQAFMGEFKGYKVHSLTENLDAGEYYGKFEHRIQKFKKLAAVRAYHKKSRHLHYFHNGNTWIVQSIYGNKSRLLKFALEELDAGQEYSEIFGVYEAEEASVGV